MGDITLKRTRVLKVPIEFGALSSIAERNAGGTPVVEWPRPDAGDLWAPLQTALAVPNNKGAH